MAKKATVKAGAKPKRAKVASKSKAVVDRRTGGRRSSDNYGDAFIKLLQSPLVAELVAAAATAALAALAQEGIGGRGRGGNAVKRAGKAAAKAIGDRLTTEVDEIKKAAKARRGAKA
ncbi:hypothetical protein [Sphingomonas sp. URHD0057]|uniref:hypothetical protein n=1 Tax=Sphingomonas sp. URHD0057 TaxID=1380389 RepID=UPI00048F2CA5|nr:hypothetical protein [Sphingomonas sp. URHD0057]